MNTILPFPNRIQEKRRENYLKLAVYGGAAITGVCALTVAGLSASILGNSRDLEQLGIENSYDKGYAEASIFHMQRESANRFMALQQKLYNDLIEIDKRRPKKDQTFPAPFPSLITAKQTLDELDRSWAIRRGVCEAVLHHSKGIRATYRAACRGVLEQPLTQAELKPVGFINTAGDYYNVMTTRAGGFFSRLASYTWVAAP